MTTSLVTTNPLDFATLAPVADQQKMMDVYVQNFGALYEDFGSAFRRIALGGGMFSLVEGQGREDLAPPLTFLILRAGSDDHCALYPRPFDQADPNPPKPYAIWHWKEGFPSYLPPHLAEKNPATDRYWYKRARRLAIVVGKPTPSGAFDFDWDHPYSLELGSSSLYGKDLPGTPNALSFSSLVGHFRRNQWHLGFVLLQAVYVPRQMTPSLRFYPLMTNGIIQYVPADAQQKIFQLMQSPDLNALVEVDNVVPTEPIPAFLMPGAAAPAQQYAQPPQQPAAQPAQYAQPTPAAPVYTTPPPPQQPVIQPAQCAQPAPAAQVVPAASATPMTPQVPVTDPTPAPAMPDLAAQAAAAIAAADQMLAQPVAAAIPDQQPEAVPSVPMPEAPPVAPTPPVATAADVAAELEKLKAGL